MGFKRFVKDKYGEWNEERKERAEFNKELSKEELKIRREAYKEEALKQARLKGIRLAKERAKPRQMARAFFREAQKVRVPTRKVAVPKRKSAQRIIIVNKTAAKKKKKKKPRTQSYGYDFTPTQGWRF